MWRQIKKQLNNRYLVVFMIVVVFLLFYSLVNTMNIFLYQKCNCRSTTELAKIQQKLTNDRETTLEQATHIVAAGILNQAIKDNDTEAIRLIMQQQKEKYNLQMALVINQQGISLNRVYFSEKQGDYILQQKKWADFLMSGHPVSLIEEGINSPLMIHSAVPIMENDIFMGALLVGKALDETYALELSNILKNGSHIIFYSNDQGIIGSSFKLAEQTVKGNETKIFLSKYFNAQSHLVDNNNKQSHLYLTIDNVHYNVKNLEFPSAQASVGGLLLLTPHQHQYLSILLALLFTALMYLLGLYYFKTGKSLLKKKSMSPAKYLILSILCLLLYFIFFVATNYTFDKKFNTLEKPPYLLYNSILKLEPDYAIIDKNFQHLLSIQVEPGGEKINAINASIKYDPKIINILDIVKTNSICRKDLFLESSIDNSRGQITIACILPDYELDIKNGIIAELIIKPIKTGNSYLEFNTNSQVLAADGLGTNVLRAVIGTTLNIQDFKENNNQLPNILLMSPTHPNSSRWYKSRDIQMTWIGNDDYEHSYLFDKYPDSIPQGENIITENQIRWQADYDGIYYFHISNKSGNNFGSVTHFKIMLDSSPPYFIEKYTSETEVHTGEVVRLSFQAADDMSGIQSYYIKINNGIFLPIDSPIYIPFTESGYQNLTIRAYDNTDNFTDDIIQIKVNGDSLIERILNIDLTKWF